MCSGEGVGGSELFSFFYIHCCLKSQWCKQSVNKIIDFNSIQFNISLLPFLIQVKN
jgi:hypothetical protein